MALDQLIEELERTHDELQRKMADPAVYSDHREAADLGRRLKELEPAVKAARDWRSASTDLAEAKDDPELASMAGELESEVARLEEELRLALVERDPADDKDVIVEVGRVSAASRRRSGRARSRGCSSATRSGGAFAPRCCRRVRTRAAG